jgi:hypothetical protein
MRRTLLAAALAASLTPTVSSNLFNPLWSLLSSLWAAPQPDAGCGWDPNGRCLIAPQPDEGCGWDPNGRCQPGS